MQILIITGNFGMGHISAAHALAARLQRDFPQADLILDDLYQIAFPKGCNNIYKTYNLLMAGPCSKLLNNAYKKAVNAEEQEAINLLEKQALHRLTAYMDMLCPDLVITTYSLAARLLADYKRKSGNPVPIVTCITDITSHNVWINPGTDLYLAAAEETKASLLRAGVAEQRIAVAGVPVSAAYQPRPKAKKTNGGPRELLIMGGGLGLLPLENEFYQGLSRITNLHATVICGHNRKLLQRLRVKHYANIEVIGYTDQVPYYMNRADLLFSKPGGITMFEAIHSELPMLVPKPFLEQEIKNAEFLAAYGMGLVLEKSPAQGLGQLEALIKSGPLLDMMRLAQRRFYHTLDEDALSAYILANFLNSGRIIA